MAAVSIRILDDTARERLRVRAIAHGRSMEADMRAILAESVRQPSLCVVMTDGQQHSATYGTDSGAARWSGCLGV
jgi:plasmid stability protein